MTHGVRTSYVKGCRCEPCRAANARYAKLAKYRVETGKHTLIDATPVKQHLTRLRNAGVGKRTIAAQSGVSATVINRLIGIDHSKPAKRIRPETARKLLAVRPDQVAGGVATDACGTTRRLQALVAMGHTQTALAARIGWTVSNLNVLVQGRREQVAVATAQLVRELYDELAMVSGPSQRARTLAAKHGWAPPLAWDDETVDDPAARPHGVDTTARWMSKRRDMAELVEDFAELRAHGSTFAHAASRLGLTEQALERALYRARRKGLTVPDFNKENAA